METSRRETDISAPARTFLVALILAVGLILAPTPGAKPALAQGQAQPGESIEALERFFVNKETKGMAARIDFEITGGYAEIVTSLPESTGRYFLASHNIQRLGPEIYRLDMSFSRKLDQDIVSFNPPHYFTEQRSYFFWYGNGDRIVFKVGNQKIAVALARKEISRVRITSLDTYEIERQKLLKDIRLTDGATSIVLQLKFI